MSGYKDTSTSLISREKLLHITSCDPWNKVYFLPQLIFRLISLSLSFTKSSMELLLLIIICRRTDFSQSARDISFLNVSLPMISGDTLIRYQNDKLNIFAFQLCAISPDSSVQWWQEQENLRDEARICSFALLNFATTFQISPNANVSHDTAFISPWCGLPLPIMNPSIFLARMVV